MGRQSAVIRLDGGSGPMRIIADTYVLDEESLRRGTTAHVYRAVNAARQQFAVKLYRSDGPALGYAQELFSRERAALTALDHPGIVRLVDAGYSEEEASHYVVLEWVDTPLRAWLQITAIEGWDSLMEEIGIPILRALRYAHERSVSHRDVKTDNVMMREGEPVLVDFGLARLLDVASLGATVRAFGTKPYAPPEHPEADHRGDLYSLGVTLIECFDLEAFDWDPSSHAKSATLAISRMDIRPQARTFLERLLAVDPDDRYATAELALHAAESSSRIAPLPKPRTRLHISVKRNVLNVIGPLVGASTKAQTEEAVVKDLGAPKGEALDRVDSGWVYRLYGKEFVFRATRDPRRSGALLLTDVSQRSTIHDEAADEAQDLSHLSVTAAYPAAASIAGKQLQELEMLLLQHRTQKQAQEAAQAEQEVLDRWLRILDLHNEVTEEREQPIEFTARKIRGQLAVLKVGKSPGIDDLVGQTRTIRTSQKASVEGDIEDAARSELSFRVFKGDALQIPERGTLIVDQAASYVSIARQRRALLATSAQQTPRSDFARLVSDPSQNSPTTPEHFIAIQTDLDDAKVRAIEAALGSPDFMVVEGPPGTGKTTMIAELILQLIRRGSRVLLSGQTHVSVDNAIERAAEIDPELRVVRVGPRGKLADSSLEYHIDDWMQRWRLEVSKAAEAELSERARDMGIDQRVITFMQYHSKAEALQHRLERLTKELMATSQLVDELRSVLDDPSADLLITLDEENVEQSGIDTESIALQTQPDPALRLQIVEAHFERLVAEEDKSKEELEGLLKDASEVAGRQLSSAQELEKLSAEVTGRETRDLRLYQRLAAIQEEWLNRFGQTQDFRIAFLATARLVAGTCIGFAGEKAVEAATFDVAVLDEASKASPTESLVPLSRATRWILVGDSRQLPPFADPDVIRRIRRSDIGAVDPKETLFGRLSADLPGSNKVTLTTQYRMIRPIGDLISQVFYEGQLKSSRQESSLSAVSTAIPKPVTWLSTSKLQDRFETRDGTSFSNATEARVVLSTLQTLELAAREADESMDVAVLCGYAAQKDRLTRTLVPRSENWNRIHLMIDTVDAYQGRESDVLVYSVTRSNPEFRIGFLRDQERLNVALSRGRDRLVIVGDVAHIANAVSRENPFIDVIRYINRRPEDCAVLEVQE